MDTAIFTIPAHVPDHLVYDFDHFTAPELLKDPHQSVSRRLHREAPEIFFTPRNGGYWIVSRAEAALDLLRHPELFSSSAEFNAAKAFNPPMLPIQADPPDHAEYRRVLGPSLTPGAIQKMEGDIRALAREIIADIRPNGGCEFVTEVGQRFPVTIFLRLAGAPLSDRFRLTAIADKYTRSPEFQDRADAIKELAAYLKEKFDDRRQNPRDDLLTRLATARFNGRPLRPDEEEGLGVLLFLGGLDSVKSAMSFILLNLAKNPAHYRRLTEDPGLIATAIEELMRVGGVSVPERGASHDFEFRNVQFRKNDRVVLLTQIWGMDDQYVADPIKVDFDREVSQHLIFGAGIHRCLGSHLARLEIRVFLEEWVNAFPTFGIAPGTEIRTVGGIVWTPVELPLAWPSN